MSASESQLQWRSVTFLVAVASMVSRCGGKLLAKPCNTESMVGDTTYFNCSTNMEDRAIFWFHGTHYVYTTLGILDPYRERYRIDHNESTGSYNLVIHSVQPGDAGQYICADDDGSGMKRSVELVVLENYPTCRSNIELDGVIGQNVFNIQPDEVHLTCNVTYYGNIPPQLQWMKAGDSSFIKDGAMSHLGANNRFTYTLKLKGDIFLENSSYICQTTRATQNQYKCKTETIKVLYFVGGNEKEQEVFIGEKITCVAHNSTMPCSSQWYHNNYTCPLSCDETITTHLLGIYLCTVKCNVRGTDYFIETLKISVVEATTPPPLLTSDKDNIVIAAAVPISIVVVLTGVIVVLLVIYKKKTSEERKAKSISGIAILYPDVFISTYECSYIEVYDSKTFDFIRRMKVNGMINPGNIAFCTVNNCLYAADLTYKELYPAILRFNHKNGNLIKFWNTHESAIALRMLLSIASDTNVILSVDYDVYLYEYAADGELIRKINLGLIEGIYKVTHAVKLDNGQLVVCWFGKANVVGLLSTKPTTDTLKRLERLDDVEILKQFGAGPEQSAINILGWPGHLSVGKDKSILVSDSLNNQAVLVSADLDEPRILVSKEHGMSFPRRTCFDKSTDRWFVADSHSIIVCQVKGENIQRETHFLSTEAPTDSQSNVQDELISDAN